MSSEAARQQSQGISFINYQLPASSLHPLPHAHHQLSPLAGGLTGTSPHFPEEASKAREGQGARAWCHRLQMEGSGHPPGVGGRGEAFPTLPAPSLPPHPHWAEPPEPKARNPALPLPHNHRKQSGEGRKDTLSFSSIHIILPIS